MVNVAHDVVPAARAIMQYRRRHDGSHWCDGGGGALAGPPHDGLR